MFEYLRTHRVLRTTAFFLLVAIACHSSSLQAQDGWAQIINESGVNQKVKIVGLTPTTTDYGTWTIGTGSVHNLQNNSTY